MYVINSKDNASKLAEIKKYDEATDTVDIELLIEQKVAKVSNVDLKYIFGQPKDANGEYSEFTNEKASYNNCFKIPVNTQVLYRDLSRDTEIRERAVVLEHAVSDTYKIQLTIGNTVLNNVTRDKLICLSMQYIPYILLYICLELLFFALQAHRVLIY